MKNSALKEYFGDDYPNLASSLSLLVENVSMNEITLQ